MSGFEVIIPAIMAAGSVYAVGSGIANENWLQAAAGAFGMYTSLGGLGTGAGTAGGQAGGASTAATQNLGTAASSDAAANTAAAGGVDLATMGNTGAMDLATEAAMSSSPDLAAAAAPSVMESLSGLGAAAPQMSPNLGTIAAAPEVGVLEGIGNSISGAIGDGAKLLGKFVNSTTGDVAEIMKPGFEKVTEWNLDKLAPIAMKAYGMYQSGKAAEEQQKFMQERYDIADKRYEDTQRNTSTWVSAPSPFSSRQKKMARGQ